MKQLVFLVPLSILLLSGCVNNNSNKRVPGEAYTEFEGTQVNGVKKVYNASGNLETEIPYKDSLPQGIQKEYYKTGKLYRETPLEKGRPNGIVKEYYTSGKLYREMPVINGRADGIVKKYYESGALLSEAPYVNGEPSVGLKEYSEKGVLFEKPKMKIKGIDRIALEGYYLFELSFSDEYIQPTYSYVETYEGKEVLSKLPIVNGKGVYKIIIPKGTILNKRFTFEARYNTLRKNIYVTRDSYTIGVTNY